MPKYKIGESVISKQEDGKPYYVFGICKTDDGYELRKLKVLGMEVLTRTTTFSSKERAHVMGELKIATVEYMINFNQKEGA